MIPGWGAYRRRTRRRYWPASSSASPSTTKKTASACCASTPRGQRDLITVLGHAAMISAGEFVQASGTWVNDRTHGVQFRASFLKAAAPTTIEGIEKYLGSGMIRGIGPIYAKKLVRAFGDAVFEIIEQEPG